MLFRTRMFLNLFARETRGENTPIFVTSLGRMKNLSFCRYSMLWYQRMLVGYSELWATVQLRVNDRVFLYHTLVSFQSDSPFPRLARKISLWWRNWIERLSFGSKHCTWPTRNALTAPRRYLQLYSCFEKRARDNPERYCGWFWSSLFYKEIWKNGTRGHGHVFESAKGKQQK